MRLSDFRSARMAAANRFSRRAHPVAAVLGGAQIVRFASAVSRKETPFAGAVCFRAGEREKSVSLSPARKPGRLFRRPGKREGLVLRRDELAGRFLQDENDDDGDDRVEKHIAAVV